MVKRENWVYGIVAALIGLLIFVSEYRVVDTQAPILVYGQFSGTPKVIATDTNGSIRLAAANDPCLDPNVAKTSVAVTATGEQVALTASQIVYVCAVYASMTGTGPTVQLQYGTGANCGTGTVNLSGAFALTVGNELILDTAGMVTKTAASNAFCLTTGGGTPTIAGLLTYVKQ